jgi:hypothetical protein
LNKELYRISGLGADKRVFDFHSFSELPEKLCSSEGILVEGPGIQ